MEISQVSVAEANRLAHAELREDLQMLEEAAHPEFGESVEEIRVRIAATRKHVIEHFRFEEQNGYMRTVRKREPRLDRIIRELLEEHRELARSLEAIESEIGMAIGLDEVARMKIRSWVERIRRHEHRENELVQDAFNLDLSAED